MVHPRLPSHRSGGRSRCRPLHLFRDRTFAIAALVGFVIGTGMFAALTVLPTFVQMATAPASPSRAS